jgi:hypothetical protein
MTVRTITGNIADLAGVSIPNAIFSLVPETYAFGSSPSVAVFGDLVTVEADSSGDVSFDLHEGKYVGRISTSQGSKTFRLTVDDVGPWTLGRLLGTVDSFTSSFAAQIFDALEQAEGFTQQAAASASTASSQASAAAGSASTASLAAIAAGAPIVTALTSPTPDNGTLELLIYGGELQVWQVVSGEWELQGVLYSPFDFMPLPELEI